MLNRTYTLNRNVRVAVFLGAKVHQTVHSKKKIYEVKT